MFVTTILIFVKKHSAKLDVNDMRVGYHSLANPWKKKDLPYFVDKSGSAYIDTKIHETTRKSSVKQIGDYKSDGNHFTKNVHLFDR